MHVYPDVAVRRWSDVACGDYQVPIIRLISYLSSAQESKNLIIKNIPEHKAIADIVHGSRLSQLLEFDRQDNCVRYLNCVPHSCRDGVRSFIMNNTAAIGITGADE